MAPKIITNIKQITPKWLSALLTEKGALTSGAVTTIEVDGGQGNWSTSARLHLNYSDNAQGTLPQNLFLKMVNTDLDDEFFGESEVTYYTRDYVDVANPPILRCYDGAYSEAERHYHLLLDDVSDTHIEAADKEPTLAYGQALAEGLAMLHARWWGAKQLAEAKAPIHKAQHIQRFVDIAQPGVAHILGSFSAQLQPHWPDLLKQLYAKHTALIIARTKDANGFTLIHGDVNQNNILVPRNGDRPIYIIDRQPFNWSLTTWLGVYDLVYAFVLYWDIEKRRNWETAILKSYHAQLIKSGITDYSWQQLYDDYRLCVPMAVYVATEYCRGGINERWSHVWLPMLQKALTACDDLDCSALW